MKFNVNLCKTIVVLLMSTLTLQASTPRKFEHEPNDLAVNATAFRGETTLHGELTPKDTDHFLWKVSKKDTLRIWEMSLSPVPKGSITVTFSKVVFQKAGLSTVSFSKHAKELKSKTDIFSFKNDSGHNTQILNPLIVGKGTYLIAVHSTTQTPYKLSFRKKEKMYGNVGKTQKYARSIYLENPYLYASKEKDAWLSFRISKKENNKIWQIHSSVTLAHDQSMSIVNESNDVLAIVAVDSFGKMHLEDLELVEGKYYIYYANARNKHYGIEVKSIGTQSINKNEIEPNNSKREANTFPLGKRIHGSISTTEQNRDYFAFKIPTHFKNKIFDIGFKSDDTALKVSLHDSNNVIQIKSTDSNYTFTGLSLTPKHSYFLEVYKYSGDTNYSIAFSKPYLLEDNKEIEPNDTPKIAPFLEHNQSIFGNFTGEEMDCSKFTVGRNNLFWSMQSKGENLLRLYLYHKDIEILRTQDKVENTLIFENLFLTKGDYALCVYGKNGSCQTSISHKNMKELNITSLDDFEHEPNQNSVEANLLHFKKSKKGLLETTSNEDFFYFTLKNSEHIRLTATPPKDGNVNIKLIGKSFSKKPILKRIILPS